MAVVISQAQNEIADFQEKGLDILPHRTRIVNEQLDVKFKKSDDPLRIVFVCAMWITGFDAPTCSTIYLDKPMRNHTLMQTIARANRVFGEKHNGLIVDYIGVFRELEKALAIYGSASGGGVQEGETPVKDKAALIQELAQAIEETRCLLRRASGRSGSHPGSRGLSAHRLAGRRSGRHAGQRRHQTSLSGAGRRSGSSLQGHAARSQS